MQSNRRNFLSFLTAIEPPKNECWLHVNRTAMACKFEVTLPRSEEKGVTAATMALDEIDRLESKLTVFRDNSEVSYVNALAAERPVQISDELFDLLSLCQGIHRDTEGAFDITAGPLTRCWGFLKRQGRLPELEEIDKARAFVGSENLLLDSAAKTIQFSEPGVEVNLGSIGKGYALDRAARLLSPTIPNVLLNAGASSMRAVGPGKDGRGWMVGLRHPRAKLKRLGVLRLRDCALSTSGNEEQFFELGSSRFSHIIDPRSGWPAEGVTSVSVVAANGALSDALATAFFVGGRELAERYCAVNRDVLVIMLESTAASPVVFGSSTGCDGLTNF